MLSGVELCTGVSVTWGPAVPIELFATAGEGAIVVGLLVSGVGKVVVPRGGSVPVIAGGPAPASGATSTRVAGEGTEAKRKSPPSVGTAIEGSLASERTAVSGELVDGAALNEPAGIGVMSDCPVPFHGVFAGIAPPWKEGAAWLG